MKGKLNSKKFPPYFLFGIPEGGHLTMPLCQHKVATRGRNDRHVQEERESKCKC
jgi:hypothetical protein